LPERFDDAFWSTGTGNYYGRWVELGQQQYLLDALTRTTARSVLRRGYAQLHRSGASAVVNASPVTEFLTASSLANKDFVFVRSRWRNLSVHEPYRCGFAGTDAAPVNMDNWFAAPVGVDLADHHRHEYGSRDRIDGDRQHLLRHDGRCGDDSEHDRSISATVLDR